uniref:Reverse transcriptase/retrotransposon-derived protein RNase H-like domain-containing protein n=1 Tax=Nicotiana tabacum TaxID=4097 RepID=A0A1S4CL82_TOBAC
MDGLQNWAKQELQRRQVTDIDQAIVEAESLMDFRHDKHDKGNGKESKSSGRQSYAEKKAQVEKKGCYICGGPHGFRNCPDLKSLSVMVRERKEQLQGESPGTAQLGMIGLCGAVTKQAIQPTENGNHNSELCMDDAKVRVIQEWEAPTKAAPLTELLKKNKPWVWTEHCQKAFEGLKTAVTEEPVLALPDFSKTFEVHTDASDFAIGGVLMQDKHPIAFESRKLNETERCYTVQEKEMTAIVHCLRTWRHYQLGSRFVVKTDNVAASYFQTQKKLTPKQ